MAAVTGAHAALYEQPITIAQGKVQGAAAFNASYGSFFPNWKDISVWKGIPYAASTAGENRWRPPQDPAAWNGTLQATEFGPGCPSSSAATTSEDCLSVNVWSPATSADEKLPVMIWSYAAGGTSGMSTYDGGGMATHGVVFVNYNYRTGPLGWLTLPALAAEDAKNVSGNYGLLDQIRLVHWVRDNIAAFGGDPDRITVSGQSFGAGATYHTVNSPLTKGLIKGAIAESGIKDPYDPSLWGYGSDYRNMSWALSFSETYAESLNATTAAELRALSVDEVLEGAGVSTFVGFDPVLDGYAIPNKYIVSLEDGAPNDVPILVGNNADEDDVSLTLSLTVDEYIAEVNETYGPAAAALLELFPAANATQAADAYNDILRAIIRVSTWSFARRWHQTESSPIYQYYWTHAPPGQDSGAFHGSEVPYALNNLYAVTTSDWEADDYAIAHRMSAYWANFVKTQNPNEGGSYKNNGSLPYWPANVPANNVTFEVGKVWETIPVGSPELIDLMLEYFYYATPDPM
ncbi:hypothetical protein ASPZODRAFT_76809 [Penicilliopsis zonata CBS 506.65]|uniref:Carboxylesterase type B domain-containing protein n=1 Tax=Penicilliopsis zonata CBS 506.65 TaxID=1073090 RepID=A0A1L9S5N2_9EURO|nr:hypothetical protein ASPZODRAFT_76809 [Penicilliopsis zonata CBS 506.65]OJJ42463.1 hypothetical protein ASPZODRAFT_76809 [Penicilliopsis zonata CBS 506.65]